MIQISEVSIISVDKSEDTWEIEGEALFESDLTTAFSVTYLPDEDELESLELDVNPGSYDKRLLKEMIVNAALEWED